MSVTNSDGRPIIRLLGGASITSGGGPLAGRVGHGARLALLAYLASSRGVPVSRERVVALLWPDAEMDRARHLLREAIYRLRESLGGQSLGGDRTLLQLNPGTVGCDLWDFEDAVARRDWTEADRLWTGDFLDGFRFDSSEFEHWLDAQRLRLTLAQAQVVEMLAAQHGAAGDHGAAVRLWSRRASTDPLNSRVARSLIESLVSAGDRAAALQHATRHAEMLLTEIGAAPDPDITALAERLRRDPPPQSPFSPAAAPPGAGSSTPAEALAGRLAASVAEAADGGVPARAAPHPGDSTPVANRAAGRWAPYAAVALLGSLLGFSLFLSPAPPLADNRVAILPFRTSGADPGLEFLGDGLVELLALEFAGEAGLQAVDPGEALRAWRVGGAGDSPAVPRAVLKVARRLGAGQAVSGSVVGTPARLTASLMVWSTRDGDLRLEPVQETGSLDSLPALAAALATRILALHEDARLGPFATANPTALRLYVEGMAEYRKAKWVDAGTRLFQAFEADSTFVPAAYRFALIHALTAPWTPLGAPASRDPRLSRLYGLLWAQRGHLHPDHQRMLEAIADSIYVRWHQQQLPRLEQVVVLQPGAVEAWELLGDAYYHAGGLLGRDDWVDAATTAFGRALELDPVMAVKAPGHLADLAFFREDARAHRRHSRAVDGPRGAAYQGYQSAILRGSPQRLWQAREAYARQWAVGEEAGPDWLLQGMTAPAGELDSLLQQMTRLATTGQPRAQLFGWRAQAAALRGRPRDARALLMAATGPRDSVGFHAAVLEWAEGDSADAERLATLALAGPATTGHPGPPHACNAALSRLRRVDTTGAAAILAIEPPLDDAQDVAAALATFRRGPVAQAAACGQVLRGVLEALTHRGMSHLYRADSMLRGMPLNYADFWNYDVALAFARHGEYGLAAAAARRRFHDLLPLPRLVLGLRLEGRWAALAGDTAAAIRAYRHYLRWRDAPEASLVPQRDSVQLELAALEARRGKRAASSR